MSSDFKPFRFPNLPFIASKQVFKHFLPMEVFDLSLCSKKMARLAKISYLKLSFQLLIDDWITFTIFSDDNDAYQCQFSQMLITKRKKDREITKKKMGGLEMDYYRITDNVTEHSFWKTNDDVVEAASHYFKAITDVFNIEYIQVFVEKSKIPVGCSEIFDWVHRIQSKANDKLIVNGHRIEDMILYETEWNFPNLSQIEKQRVQHWTMSRSRWLRVDDIFELNFITLTLHDAHLTGQELNVLIRRLLFECKDRMEVINMHLDEAVNEETVLDGINASRSEEIKHYRRFGWKCPIGAEGELAYNIQLNDGRECTINFVKRNQLCYQVRIFIWRKDDAL